MDYGGLVVRKTIVAFQSIPSTNIKRFTLYTFALLFILQLIYINLLLRDILSYQKIKTIPYTPKTYKVLSYESSTQDIKKAVIEEFGQPMAQIVACESDFNPLAYNKHNKNGTTDGGLFQINSSHKSTAKKMGIDLDTIQGQFDYAKFLVNKNGYKDWVCSHKLGIVK